VTHKIAFILLAAGLGTGCASINFRPDVNPVGDISNDAPRDVIADGMRWQDASDVRVLQGNLPPGVAVGPDGSVTIQNPRYQWVGNVSASPKEPAAANLGFWFYDYPEDQSWRKVYCGVQVPLSWVTLSLWSWLSPTYYPCRVLESNGSGDVDARKARIISTLRKAAKAVGGNLLVVTSIGGRSLTVDTGYGVTTYDKLAMTGTGLALRDLSPTEK
jgi:hypothetical protein